MKINNKINRLLVVGVFALTLVGCEYEYDQEYPPANKPVASISPLSLSAAEGDTVTFTVTLNEPTDIQTEFKLTTQDDQSEAVEGEDFVVPGLAIYPVNNFGQQGFQVNLSSLATTYTFDVVITEDILADDGESAILRFNSAGNGMAIVQGGHQQIVIDITNKETFNDATSEDLGVKLAWAGTATFPILITDPDTGETSQGVQQDFNLCNLDFDVLLEVPPNGSQTYLAGTANCPEVGVLAAAAPDGTYTLLVDYYDDAGQENVIAPVAVPLQLTVSNIGAADGTTSYPDLFDISTPVSLDEGGGPIEIATIVKSGSNYTVTNSVTGEVFYP